MSIFGVGEQAHLQANEASIAAGSGLEHLEVLVDGNRIQDVLHKDTACADHMHAFPAVRCLLATQQQTQL